MFTLTSAVAATSASDRPSALPPYPPGVIGTARRIDMGAVKEARK